MPEPSLSHLPVAAPAGGAFLFTPAGTDRIFSVEDLNEEQRAMATEAGRFVQKEVVPRERALESKDGKAAKDMIKVLKKACKLGLAQVEVPEAYGGLGADKVTSLLIADKVGESGDFSVTWGAHSGIGLAPILYFGTDEQKQRWVEAIAGGSKVSCYALSEPGSGSDALGARCTARLNDAGTHYILNGTKQWITNAAWMDIGVVFAKVDGDKFTAFVVERGMAGLEHGTEEHKLGLRGSSTCQLIFTDTPVPVENVLGEVGKGHKVAFNTLNLGRIKLAGGVISMAKRAIADAIRYAADRKQFNTRVVDFGAIREQVADSIIQTYLVESLTYRIAGAIDARLHDVDHDAADYVERQMAAIEEYALEASIAKVYGSEALAQILDRCLQWHGGYGFVEDYSVEKFVRDARVYRIFEGTNEINRLLIPGTLFKRAMQKRLGLMRAIGATEQAAANGFAAIAGDAEPLALAQVALERIKALALLMLAAASGKHGMALDGEQETLVQLANLVTDAYAVDSAVARTLQRQQAGDADATLAAVCAVAAVEALERSALVARRLVFTLFSGEDASTWAAKVAAVRPEAPVNLLPWRRAIAARAIADGGYKLSSY